jgi:hypothetical protein
MKIARQIETDEEPPDSSSAAAAKLKARTPFGTSSSASLALRIELVHAAAGNNRPRIHPFKKP